MTPRPIRTPARTRAEAAAVALALLAVLAGVTFSAPSGAQNPVPPARPVVKPAAEDGARWPELKPAQQAALRPLEHDWSQIDAAQKQKWLELSGRFPKMTPAEQTRVQERMSEWTKLTPQQRGQARLNFQEAKLVPAEDRQARWNAYQALSPEEKRQLAARAAPVAEAPHKPGAPFARSEKPAHDLPQGKSNMVANPTFAAPPPKAVAPTVLQARPGATTTPITKQATPPSHQQTGLPKIAATPEFVNKATLLPQRGPQGAATRSAAAPTPPAPTQR